MKRVSFAVALVMLLSFVSIAAQTAIDGFLDVPFGATPEKTLQILSKRPQTRLTIPLKDGTMVFTGPFAGYDKALLSFSFERNSMVVAGASVECLDVESCFTTIRELLEEKYGPSISAGNNLCGWKLDGPKGSQKYLILLGYGSDIVTVGYYDEEGFEAYRNSKDKARAKDL